MVERAGRAAKFAFKAHPHMLWRACGYALANKGRDTRSLQAPGPPQHPAYRPLHRIVADPVQGFLASVNFESPSGQRAWSQRIHSGGRRPCNQTLTRAEQHRIWVG